MKSNPVPKTESVPKRRLSRSRLPLEAIPSIGPRIAALLGRLGVTEVAHLREADPQELYDRLCVVSNTRLDPCVLYTFRCAVYFASTENPAPEKLRWWYWKEGR